jgi:IS30 family transposase
MRKKFVHLSVEEREEISLAWDKGKGIREISRILNRDSSTVSREIKRNSDSQSLYRVVYADKKSRQRARIPKKRNKLANPVLWKVVKGYLDQKWSPEQIAFSLKKEYPQDMSMQVSHETIYKTVYIMPRGSLKKEMIASLRQGHKRRHHKKASGDKRGQLTDMLLIKDRPKEVESRKIPGHWEGDLIKGKRNRSAIGTIVERKSRFLSLVRIRSLDAPSVCAAFGKQMNLMPKEVRKTLTYDRGKELAEHKALAEIAKIKVYFADPHSPWQRATCENTNGLLRQYFPKGMDLSKVTRRELDRVAMQLNTRPRKGLGWKTPLEVIQQFAKIS